MTDNAPAGLEAERIRDISGETMFGVRVAGWRWKSPIPESLQGSKWMYSYASHYSTGPDNAVRLFTEEDVLTLLRAAQEREKAALDRARELERIGTRLADWIEHEVGADLPEVEGEDFRAALAGASL